MATAQNIISKSMRMLGVLASGDSATTAELDDGLISLNSLVDSWAADPNFYFTEQDEAFTIVAKVGHAIGNAALTISTLTSVTTTATATTLGPHGLESGNKVTVSGAVEANYNVTAVATVTSPTAFTYPISTTTSPATGSPVVTAGDFYTDRPIRIVGAFTRATTVDSPLGLITERYWTNIADKQATAAIPTKLLYRPNYPFGQIILYPVPTGTPVLHLKSEKAVSQFSALTTVKVLPPGYQRMLELALAIDIAPEYGTKVSDTVLGSIKANFQSVIEVNQRNLETSRLQGQQQQQAA